MKNKLTSFLCSGCRKKPKRAFKTSGRRASVIYELFEKRNRKCHRKTTNLKTTEKDAEDEDHDNEREEDVIGRIGRREALPPNTVAGSNRLGQGREHICQIVQQT